MGSNGHLLQNPAPFTSYLFSHTKAVNYRKTIIYHLLTAILGQYLFALRYRVKQGVMYGKQ